MLARFHDILPEIAEREVRGFTVVEDPRLPAGEYGLLEFFCVDPACDCRRVSLMVMRRGVREPQAMISHAFVGGDIDPIGGRTYLDPLHKHARHAPALLEFVANMLETDRVFAQRLERHYLLTKQAVADPRHPCHARLAQTGTSVRGERGSHLRAGTVGTAANPIMLRVPDDATAARMAKVAEELNVHYLMKLAPGEAADLSDVDFIGRDRGPPAQLSRHERRAWEKQHRRR